MAKWVTVYERGRAGMLESAEPVALHDDEQVAMDDAVDRMTRMTGGARLEAGFEGSRVCVVSPQDGVEQSIRLVVYRLG